MKALYILSFHWVLSITAMSTDMNQVGVTLFPTGTSVNTLRKKKILAYFFQFRFPVFFIKLTMTYQKKIEKKKETLTEK